VEATNCGDVGSSGILIHLHLNKKHLKNCWAHSPRKPPHAQPAGVATGTVARRLRIDVHDANDNDDNDNA